MCMTNTFLLSYILGFLAASASFRFLIIIVTVDVVVAYVIDIIDDVGIIDFVFVFLSPWPFWQYGQVLG